MSENLANLYETTLTGAIDAVQTSIPVASVLGAPSPNFRLVADKEIMLVTGVVGTSFTVQRGMEGTTAAAHLDGTPVANVMTRDGLAAIFARLDATNSFSQKQTFASLQLTTGASAGFFLVSDNAGNATWQDLPTVAVPNTYNNVTVDKYGRVTGGSNAAYLLGTGVTPNTYNNVTVNSDGLVTAGSNVAYLTGNQTITLSGDATGSGATAIAVTVAKLQGRAVANTAPSNRNLLMWNATSSDWEPAALSASDIPQLAHSSLSQLDYASAGHTGFAGTGVSNTFSASQLLSLSDSQTTNPDGTNPLSLKNANGTVHTYVGLSLVLGSFTGANIHARLINASTGASALGFSTYGGVAWNDNALYINESGRVLVGTTTDNGSDLLQVNDAVFASTAFISGGRTAFSKLGRAFAADGTSPGFIFYVTGQAADSGLWDMFAVGTQFAIRAINDAVNSASDVLIATRSAVTITSVAFPAGNILVGSTTDDGSNKLQVTGNSKFSGSVGIGGTPSYQLEVHGSGASTDGVFVTTSAYTSIANPGSISNAIALTARGFNLTTDGVTLSSGYQPTLGAAIAVGRSDPALALKNTVGPALAIEAGSMILSASTTLGFYGATAAGKQTVTGSRGANAALASLLTALATIGLITDSST